MCKQGWYHQTPKTQTPVFILLHPIHAENDEQMAMRIGVRSQMLSSNWHRTKVHNVMCKTDPEFEFICAQRFGSLTQSTFKHLCFLMIDL